MASDSMAGTDRDRTGSMVGMDAEEPTRDRPFAFHDGRVSLLIDLRAYRLSAVQKAAYRMAARCTVVFGAVGDHTVEIALVFPPATEERDANLDSHSTKFG